MDRFERMEIDRTDRIEASPGGGTPTQDSNHGDVDMRLSTTSQSIQSVVSVASNIPNNQTGSFQQQTKRRCRDFDGMYVDTSKNRKQLYCRSFKHFNHHSEKSHSRYRKTNTKLQLFHFA